MKSPSSASHANARGQQDSILSETKCRMLQNEPPSLQRARQAENRMREERKPHTIATARSYQRSVHSSDRPTTMRANAGD